MIAVLNVDDVTTHVATQTKTTVLQILAVEPFDGAAGQALSDQLAKRVETRTGESAMFTTDGAVTTDAQVGGSTGDQVEYDRQVELMRKERAAKLREQAENVDDKAEADRLEADADAFETGNRDAEIHTALSVHFDDGAQPALASV